MADWNNVYNSYKDLGWGQTAKHFYKGTGTKSGQSYAQYAWARDGGNPDEFSMYEQKYADKSGTYQQYWDSVSFGNVVAKERKEAQANQVRKNDQAREDLMYRQQKASEGQSSLLTSGNDRSQSGQGATLVSGKEGVMLTDANKKRKTLLGA
mgnify:CR=1 FL=1